MISPARVLLHSSARAVPGDDILARVSWVVSAFFPPVPTPHVGSVGATRARFELPGGPPSRGVAPPLLAHLCAFGEFGRRPVRCRRLAGSTMPPFLARFNRVLRFGLEKGKFVLCGDDDGVASIRMLVERADRRNAPIAGTGARSISWLMRHSIIVTARCRKGRKQSREFAGLLRASLPSPAFPLAIDLSASHDGGSDAGRCVSPCLAPTTLARTGSCAL
jgi:hypothetical protein